MKNEINLTETFDAKIWVQEWMRIIKDHPNIPYDEGAMIGWFANAIMAGYDTAKREDEKELRDKPCPTCGRLCLALRC